MPESPPPSFRAIAVVGAGAVGSWFGGLLALAGQRVTLVGRLPHVQAVQRHGLRLQVGGDTRTAHPEVTTELAGVRGADLVLVCVKCNDTEGVARELAPLLDADALVLSLQNGVENVATLARHLRQAVMPAAVYAATALPEPGLVQHFGGGEIVVGPAGAASNAADSRLQAVVAVFAAAGVAVRLSPNVMTELWAKLVVNCACNAISALTQTSYAQMAAVPAVQALQHAAVHEAVAVARADGHDLAPQALLAAVARIAATMPAQRSSTAQDLARGRPTEIQYLNGHIVRRGAALGIATPANQGLTALVQLAETTAQGWSTAAHPHPAPDAPAETLHAQPRGGTAQPLVALACPHPKHPWLWHFSRHGLALGMAPGIFSGLLLPLAQIPFSAAAAGALRANVPAAVASTLVTNPVTFGPVWYAAWRLGSTLLGEKEGAGGQPPALAHTAGAPADTRWGQQLKGGLARVGKPLLLGLAILASGIGLLSCFVISWAWAAKVWWTGRRRLRAAAANRRRL